MKKFCVALLFIFPAIVFAEMNKPNKWCKLQDLKCGEGIRKCCPGLKCAIDDEDGLYGKCVPE